MSQTPQVAAPPAIPGAGGIVVNGLRRSFGDVRAVRDITFEARPGRVTALIGPNGAGKTTLLLMLATLLTPDAGTISVGGHDPVTSPSAVRRVMGWMPDALGSWNALSVRRAIEVTALLYGMTTERARERADELLSLVSLESLAQAPTRALSRGQKQRLSLARALVHDPSVLLLDEPASGLDPAARVALRELVRGLARDGRTVLVSSHVLAELEELADDAVYVEGGASVSAERLARAGAAARPWRIRSIDPAHLSWSIADLGVPTADVSTIGDAVLLPFASDDEAASFLAELVRRGVRVTAFAPAIGDFERTFQGLGDVDGAA
ncbi:ABC transporter ATP-binding protein [Labedella endophytica]|uniref:ABC transporter ATP-binding protein n=1 Tax=Labedella endophytica TaxID=1523160 RepID=A0A433JQM1_9MICO|nr:ABC transporter ATP-binding protein [Labedella endophytica]RUQ99177.1 ABC transporter ATP-binding protein [Labedella endophytica]